MKMKNIIYDYVGFNKIISYLIIIIYQIYYIMEVMRLIEEYLAQNDMGEYFLVKKEPNSVTFTLKHEIYYSVEIKKIGSGYKIYPSYEDHDNCLLIEKEVVFESLNHYLGTSIGLHMGKKLQRKLEDTTRFSCYIGQIQ